MSKITVALWTKPNPELSAEANEAAANALREVEERCKGLPVEAEVYVGSAKLRRGELVVVLLPLRAQAHREVMKLLVSPLTQADGPDRVYAECLWHVVGQPEPGLVAARKHLSDLATNAGGSIAAARFNIALSYLSALSGDEGKD